MNTDWKKAGAFFQPVIPVITLLRIIEMGENGDAGNKLS